MVRLVTLAMIYSNISIFLLVDSDSNISDKNGIINNKIFIYLAYNLIVIWQLMMAVMWWREGLNLVTGGLGLFVSGDLLLTRPLLVALLQLFSLLCQESFFVPESFLLRRIWLNKCSKGDKQTIWSSWRNIQKVTFLTKTVSKSVKERMTSPIYQWARPSLLGALI